MHDTDKFYGDMLDYIIFGEYSRYSIEAVVVNEKLIFVKFK